MKTLSLEQMETTEGGKFWGTDYEYFAGDCWWQDYYVAWVRVSRQLLCAGWNS